MTVKGVVMAGGKGTRLRPITYSIPKPLVPIAGRPCIGYTLDSFFKAGVRNVIITTGYKFESLIEGVLEFKNADQNILFSVEREPAGTAGSVKMASKFLDDTFVVGSGDVLADFDIKELLDFHRKKKAKLTIALTTVEDPSQLGVVDLKDGIIRKFIEKPPRSEAISNLVNAGIYVAEPEVLDHIPAGVPYDFARDLFPKLIMNGFDIHGFEATGTWLDAGRPMDMIMANKVMTKKYGKKTDSSNVKGEVILNTPQKKLENCRIAGSTYIGSEVSIGQGSTVSDSAIYDDVYIGSGVEIVDSMIMDSVRIMDGTKITQSVIMKGTVIGNNCEISHSVLSPRLNLHDNSRVYDVSLSSEVIEEEN